MNPEEIKRLVAKSEDVLDIRAQLDILFGGMTK